MAIPWHLAVRFARRYFPQLMLPVTITVGFIGYSIENYLRPPIAPPTSKSTSEMREERRLRELQQNPETPHRSES
jgi:hypothetical protein